MSNFVPEKVFLRRGFLYSFNRMKISVERHRILKEVYAEHVLSERPCEKSQSNARKLGIG